MIITQANVKRTLFAAGELAEKLHEDTQIAKAKPKLAKERGAHWALARVVFDDKPCCKANDGARRGRMDGERAGQALAAYAHAARLA